MATPCIITEEAKQYIIDHCTLTSKEIKEIPHFDEEKLKDVLDHLSCMDESKWTDSENAQIKDYTKDGYEVQPEVYGTKIDKDAFTEKIKEALDKMQPEFDLSGEGCYEDPKVKE
jgi:vancomycin resistance protein YoaR